MPWHGLPYASPMLAPSPSLPKKKAYLGMHWSSAELEHWQSCWASTKTWLWNHLINVIFRLFWNLCLGYFDDFLGDPQSKRWKTGRVFGLRFAFQELSRCYLMKMFRVLPNSKRQRPALSELANLGTCAIWCDLMTTVRIQGHMRLPFLLKYCNYWGHKAVSKEKKLIHYTCKLFTST